MVCSDIDMCKDDVYTIFNYPIVQNTNVNDKKVLLNIKFMLFTEFFWNDYDVVCIAYQIGYAMNVINVLILCMNLVLEQVNVIIQCL